MKLGDKIATILFWFVASILAVVVAGDRMYVAVVYSKPWLFVASILVCVVAAYGVRECVRSVKNKQKGNDAA